MKAGGQVTVGIYLMLCIFNNFRDSRLNRFKMHVMTLVSKHFILVRVAVDREPIVIIGRWEETREPQRKPMQEPELSI